MKKDDEDLNGLLLSVSHPKILRLSANNLTHTKSLRCMCGSSSMFGPSPPEYRTPSPFAISSPFRHGCVP